jgi:hypothetical protein
MNNKALRLPIILVALMLMVSIAWNFRPKTTMTVRDNSAPTETFNPDKLDPNMVIDGRKVSDYATLESTQTPGLSAGDPKTWTAAHISMIKTVNGTTILYFVDGSSRPVTPTLVKLLPSEVQLRLSYEGPQ